jgi:hypothetical protein
MAEAPLEWKIKFLKDRMAHPDGGLLFAHGCDETEMRWIKDMQKDGLVEGEWASSGDGQVFHEFRVTEKGKKMIQDYESPKTEIAALKANVETNKKAESANEHEGWDKKPVGKVTLTVVGGVILLIIAAILAHYFPQWFHS